MVKRMEIITPKLEAYLTQTVQKLPSYEIKFTTWMFRLAWNVKRHFTLNDEPTIAQKQKWKVMQLRRCVRVWVCAFMFWVINFFTHSFHNVLCMDCTVCVCVCLSVGLSRNGMLIQHSSKHVSNTSVPGLVYGAVKRGWHTKQSAFNNEIKNFVRNFMQFLATFRTHTKPFSAFLKLTTYGFSQ